MKKQGMQILFYAGHDGQACRVEYGIIPTCRTYGRGADIVILHSSKLGPITSLINSDKARDSILNRILATDLPGIRMDLIRFFVLFDLGSIDESKGSEFPIALDLEDYKNKGHRVLTEYLVPDSLRERILWALGFRRLRRETIRHRDVLAGGARCYTPFEKVRSLNRDEVDALCQSIGHRPFGKHLPKWLTDQVVITSHNQ